MKIAAALLFGSILGAATPVGPTAGWTLDSRTASIRAITGLPGALRLADSLALPFGISAAEFAPSGDTAVALTSGQPQHLALVNALRSAAPAAVDLGEVVDGSRILALNGKGTAALLYAAAQQELRFVSGLNDTPVMSGPVSTATLTGAITAGVLDDAGQCAVLGTGSVEQLCADGSSRRVVPDSTFRVTGLALAGADLWVADAAGPTVSRISNYATQPSATVFASVNDGLSQPLGLAVAPSGQVVVADSGTPAIFLIDPSAGGIRMIALDLAPKQLRPLTDRSLLLINDLSALPFTLLATEAMRTYFVPAN